MSYAARAQSLIANRHYEVRKNEKDEITPLAGAGMATKETKKLLPPFSADETAKWTVDPRPDLVDDSGLWTRLLAAAYALNGHDPAGFFGALAGLRCEGAHLVVERGRIRLEAGEIGDEYPALRQAYLTPHTLAIRDLFTAFERGERPR